MSNSNPNHWRTRLANALIAVLMPGVGKVDGEVKPRKPDEDGDRAAIENNPQADEIARQKKVNRLLKGIRR